MDKYGIIDIEHIDYSKITIGPLRGLPTGPDRSETSSMKTSRILYDGLPLKVRLAKMPTSWGLSPPLSTDKNSAQPYRLELSMGRDPENTGVYKLCTFLDNAVRRSAEENPKDFLSKRNFSADLFDERYKSPCLRFSRDRTTGEIKDYPPFIRINVPIVPGGETFQVDGFFSSDRKPIHVNTSNATQMISRNDQCRCIVLFDKIWANQLGFGCKLKLIQMRVYKTAMRLGDVDMTGGEDEEEAGDVTMMAHSDSEEDHELMRASKRVQELRRVEEATF